MADFDAFWADAKARYDREVPVDVKLEKLDRFSNEQQTAYRLIFPIDPAEVGLVHYTQLPIGWQCHGRRHLTAPFEIASDWMKLTYKGTFV